MRIISLQGQNPEVVEMLQPCELQPSNGTQVIYVLDITFGLLPFKPADIIIELFWIYYLIIFPCFAFQGTFYAET